MFFVRIVCAAPIPISDFSPGSQSGLDGLGTDGEQRNHDGDCSGYGKHPPRQIYTVRKLASQLSIMSQAIETAIASAMSTSVRKCRENFMTMPLIVAPRTQTKRNLGKKIRC
jgi:hypothetical protein